MMSTKWTFSFLTLMLVGLLVAVPAALANEIKLRVTDANHAGPADPADVSVEDGIQVLAGTLVTVTLTSAEALLMSSVEVADFEVVNATIDATNGITRVEPKKYTITFDSASVNTADTEVTIILVPKKLTSAETGDSDSTGASLKFKYVNPDTSVSGGVVDEPNAPKVVSIVRATAIGSTIASAFVEDVVSGEFLVKIVLTEKPNGGLASAKLADRIKALSVSGGAATDVRAGIAFARDETAGSEMPPLSEGGYAAIADVPSPTGRDAMYYPYLATIVPDGSKDKVVVKVKAFEDTVLPGPNRYTPPATDAAYREGIDKLTIKVSKAVLTTKTTGFEVPTVQATTAVDEKSKTEVTQTTAAPTATVLATVPDTSVMIPKDGRIYISEIMLARGKHGTLPQWIEISNGSRTEEVNLSGWTITVQNATADSDVSVGAKAVFTIPEGTRINPSGQHDTPSTVLVATDTGRNNLDGRMADGQVVNLWVDQQVELFLLGISNRRYSLLSDIAFQITLAPPAPDVFAEQTVIMKRKAATDVVGNLAADGTAAWTLPMREGDARCSIIRRHISAEPRNGEMADSWVLASDTGFTQPMHLNAHSYYGLSTDVGTPGFRAGGALPVELSSLRPERNKETGAVVITWSTQSEMNNAGFFIKRSQQRDGEFRVINMAMIPGAGTTSEKQFYTYTDTTAEGNVVYYYQIEDVSFDGERQVLTRGIRLRGHVGAAGKATVMWGELKGR